jgi:RHS repeat-associated protein
MNLVDRANRQRSLTAMSRTLRSGRIAANASVPTTTYAYDANGNLIQAGGWSYMWDYLNRMLASGYANSTTTYAYDPSGSRVLQTSTTSTTYYPNKYYSFTSTKSGANTYATSTNYVFNGDTLLATIDQALYNGAATGSPTTRYIHPDHLGSTNAVTDQNGSLVQLMDYYPYGASRIAPSTYPTNEKRQYIGQFSDAQTNLNYLNARFYDSSRGQFTSEDPLFWGKQNLTDPQSLNAYSYAQDNPVTKKDPTGLTATPSTTFWQSVVNFLQSYVSYLTSGGGGGGNVVTYKAANSDSTAPAVAKPQPPYGYGGATTMNDYFNYQFSQTVKSYIGTPYNEKTDAVGPDYFDCSGAVVAGIRKVANPKFGRHTADQLYNNYTTPLPDTGGPGTLIFYNNKLPSSPDRIDHVATYVGNGMIVDPNGTQGQVKLNPTSYESNYTNQNNGNIYNAQIDWNEVMSDQ